MKAVSICVVLVVFATTAFAEPRLVAPAPIQPTSFWIDGASIAASADGFMSVWPVNTFVGQRIDGITLDRDGRRVTNAARPLVSNAVAARVLRAGNGFLLTYEDPLRIRHFTRLNADGSVASGESLPVLTNAPIVVETDDGNRILVVRYDINRVTALMLDGNGSVVRDEIVLASGNTQMYGLYPAGSDFLLLRSFASGFKIHRISPAGQISTESMYVEKIPNGRGCAAASDGDRSLLLCNFATTGGRPTLSGYLIRGTTLEKSIDVARSIETNILPQRLFWTGDSYLLIASTGLASNESIVAMRFDRNGEPMVDPVALTAEPFREIFSGAAWNGNVVVVTAWEIPSISGARNVTFTFGAHGAIGDVRRDVISLLPARQNAPASASDGRSSLVAWREGGVDGQRLRARVIDGPADAVTVFATDGLMGEPAVAFGGGVYLAVWEYFHRLFAARIDSRGALIDSTPITIAAADNAHFGTPAVAWNGERFLVAWSGFPIQGAFVTPAGAVSGPLDLTTSQYGGNDPALAFNGRRFLLTFTAPLPMPIPVVPAPSEVVGVALTSDGSIVNAQPALLVRSATHSAIATSGNEFLVIADADGVLAATWAGETSYSLGREFKLGPVAPPAFGTTAAVAWDGTSYVVARHRGFQNDWILRAERLAPGATEPYDIRILPSRPDRLGGRSVSLAAGTFVFFTDIRDDVASGGSARLLFDQLKDLPPQTRRRSAGH